LNKLSKNGIILAINNVGWYVANTVDFKLHERKTRRFSDGMYPVGGKRLNVDYKSHAWSEAY
jgi:DNA-binding GntR family transcriptional regulator